MSCPSKNGRKRSKTASFSYSVTVCFVSSGMWPWWCLFHTFAVSTRGTLVSKMAQFLPWMSEPLPDLKKIFSGGSEGGTLYIGYWRSAFSVSSCAGCHSARRQVGRGSGPAAAGRCPTVSGHWDCRWCHDCPYQAQHHHPHQADPDLHHLLRQPAWSIDPGGYKLVMHGVFSVLNLNLCCVILDVIPTLVGWMPFEMDNSRVWFVPLFSWGCSCSPSLQSM